MTLTFEQPEPFMVEGANWPVLEYLIERFNRPALEGEIRLRRSMFSRDLQLCPIGECCGEPITVLSESFDDTIIGDAEKREQLVSLVSRFLLKVKCQHRKQHPQ